MRRQAESLEARARAEKETCDGNTYTKLLFFSFNLAPSFISFPNKKKKITISFSATYDIPVV